MIRTYSELVKLPTFVERYNYLRLGGKVGEDTFGFDRYLNQMFYSSHEWKTLRREIIVRDHGQDLAMEGFEIPNGVRVYVHHMNPIRPGDILYDREYLMNPEYLITTTKRTHDAIHYGDESQLFDPTPVERFKNDMAPWRI